MERYKEKSSESLYNLELNILLSFENINVVKFVKENFREDDNLELLLRLYTVKNTVKKNINMVDLVFFKEKIDQSNICNISEIKEFSINKLKSLGYSLLIDLSFFNNENEFKVDTEFLISDLRKKSMDKKLFLYAILSMILKMKKRRVDWGCINSFWGFLDTK